LIERGEHRIIQARSISTRLSTILSGNDQKLKVVSSYDHACNLQNSTGALIALVTPPYGNGPFHIVIPAVGLSTVNIKVNTNPYISLHTDKLTGEDFTILLTPAQYWNPLLPPLTHFAASTFTYLLNLYRASDVSSIAIGVDSAVSKSLTAGQSGALAQTSYAMRVQQGIRALRTGLTTENKSLLEEGVYRLAGLGPGLTPAGDDFLVGLLAALYAGGPLLTRKPWAVLQAQCEQIATVAASRTTTLSATWLTCAGQGAFGETWHDLINRINQQKKTLIAQALTRILATGASSGADALSGFLWGMQLMPDMG